MQRYQLSGFPLIAFIVSFKDAKKISFKGLPYLHLDTFKILRFQ